MSSDLEVETSRRAVRVTAEQLARSIDLLGSVSGPLARERLEILEQRMWTHQARLKRLLSEL